MDFFRDLNRYVEGRKEKLQPLTVQKILDDPGALRRFDTVIVANDFMPGHSADGSGRYGQSELRAYADALADFARRGGNLTLTDAAMTGLPALGTGLRDEDVRGGVFYAGWIDFDDGDGATYDRHHLASGVDKEGTAEGQDTVDGQEFEHRHQTYEPVPLGYYVDQGGSGNARCTRARCDSPNWTVDQEAWEAAGGTTAGRTLVRSTTEPGSKSSTGTSLGELPLGSGVVRVAGALLPDPTETNHHPFGLSSYALTYTGYQVVENLLDYRGTRGRKR